MKKISIIMLIMTLTCSYSFAQETGQTGPRREVTLYNVYKPLLTEKQKRSFLPIISDTVVLKPEVTYDVDTKPFYPRYGITPLRAANIDPDPLPKLYKSYLNLGFGNYFTPFGELSITNERSKEKALGFYARHFSTNGKIKLDNDEKVLAGYMDNEVSFYGKKFFRNSILEGTVDYDQKTRYPYGINTLDTTVNYPLEPVRDLKSVYHGIGGTVSFGSMSADSSDLSYDFALGYDLFLKKDETLQHHAELEGALAKEYKGFYVQLDMGFDYYLTGETSLLPEYTFSLGPSVSKGTSLWNFKVGARLVVDDDVKYSTSGPLVGTDNLRFLVYPDIRFGFGIMPTYMDFFIGLTGGLDKNMARSVLDSNPYVDKLFVLNNTNNSLVAEAGLKGNNGIGGNYLLSASYSLVEDMVFYSPVGQGRYFEAVYDDVDMINIHGEVDGKITDKLSYDGSANWYDYSLAGHTLALNKPDWDATFGLKYNLRNKIIAGADVMAVGGRTLSSRTYVDELLPLFLIPDVTTPYHVNLNFNAEYRYTKILSFWLKANNIGINRYYEYANYPTQRFLFMLGFSYSM